MHVETNVLSHKIYGQQNPRENQIYFSKALRQKAKRHRYRRGTVRLAFLLAIVLTPAFAVWVLNQFEVAPPVFDAANSLHLSITYQNPELKNGCEATSLAMLLCYNEYSVDKSTLAYNYIPREDFSNVNGVRYGPHPSVAYPGDPATSKGFYCYPGPVIAGANQFLTEQSSELQAFDISGASEDQLAQTVRDGYPVMVWVTMDYGTTLSFIDYTWQLPDGQSYTPLNNLHCVVLSGVDEQMFEVCDPIKGVLHIDRQTVFRSYTALGSMAVVIK